MKDTKKAIKKMKKSVSFSFIIFLLLNTQCNRKEQILTSPKIVWDNTLFRYCDEEKATSPCILSVLRISLKINNITQDTLLCFLGNPNDYTPYTYLIDNQNNKMLLVAESRDMLKKILPNDSLIFYCNYRIFQNITFKDSTTYKRLLQNQNIVLASYLNRDSLQQLYPNYRIIDEQIIQKSASYSFQAEEMDLCK